VLSPVGGQGLEQVADLGVGQGAGHVGQRDHADQVVPVDRPASATRATGSTGSESHTETSTVSPVMRRFISILAAPGEAVMRTLSLVGVDAVIDCRDTLRQALSD
jgi:hypothetical protein